ncbi:MAG: acyltransferase [Bacilli bacterium]|nr:acyltransferase [Bacilli bacterium]
MDGYYSNEELKRMGFKSIGERVLISKKASIYNPSNISIGNDVRIDDFCLLVGNITLGNFIHLAPYVSIHGTGDGSVTMKDFSALSSYTTVYASSDDYSGNSITNPTVGEKYERIIASDIVIEKHAIVGLHSVILPNAYLAEGVALGAMSLLAKPTEPWGIYVGIPCKRIKERLKDCLEMEKEIYKNLSKV